MDSYSDLQCWEIINCSNLECSARNEPEIPCWAIAEKNASYHYISNTCRDCIVFLLKRDTAMFTTKEAQEIFRHRKHSEMVAAGFLACA